MSYSLEPRDQWPLPGQTDPGLTPCAFCRRRLRRNGRPLFRSCSCKSFGPDVTIGALAAGAALVVVGGWLWWRKR